MEDFFVKNFLLIVLKIVLAVATLIYPLFMVILSGAGLVFNGNSYGLKLVLCGIFWIVSGLMLTSGSLLCLMKKNIPALILSSAGFLICMAVLFIVTAHAEKYSWNMPYYAEFTVSGMYIKRIIPTALPFILTLLISGFKICKK